MTYLELREQVASLLCQQTTLDCDWESRKTWVKESFRKNADQVFKLINDSGWTLQPKREIILVS